LVVAQEVLLESGGYIAKADVALSVVMTVCSTLAAVILTPILTQLFAGTLVPVDTWMLFKQTLQVVILPVVLAFCSIAGHRNWCNA